MHAGPHGGTGVCGGMPRLRGAVEGEAGLSVRVRQHISMHPQADETKTMMRSCLTIVFVLLAVCLLPGEASAATQYTFTYQGNLTDTGKTAAGTYDLQFRLYDQASLGNQIGSTLTNLDQVVSNGLFTTELDFGLAAFGSGDRFLLISVRPGGSL